MIDKIMLAASNAGITVFITNSEDKIETQLNRITGQEQLPIMLVSWDINTTAEFDDDGFLKNPISELVVLLLTKPILLTAEAAKASTEQMVNLFLAFIQDLHYIANEDSRDGKSPLTEISFLRVPMHGAGKHSGVLGKWKMKAGVTIACDALPTIPIVNPPVGPFNVVFTVYNTTDGKVVPGASIAFAGQTLVTDALGKATFSTPLGIHEYVITVSGYTTKTSTITVSGPVGVGTSIAPIVASYAYSFLVSDSNGVLAGAVVTCNGAAIETNALGISLFTLSAGTYTYSVILAGYYASSGSITVAADGQKAITLTVWTPPFLKVFWVRDELGAVIVGASVTCNGQTFLTSIYGDAAFSLYAGTYDYSVVKDGYTTINSSTEVINATSVNVTMIVAPEPTSYIRNFLVSDINGVLVNAGVTINGVTRLTNSLGIASFTLTVGVHNYSVAQTGYTTVNDSIDVTTSGTTNITLTGSITLILRGFTVSDSSGVLEGATVTCNGVAKTTNFNGEAVFSLPAGTYAYTVEKAGYTTVADSITFTALGLTYVTMIVAPDVASYLISDYDQDNLLLYDSSFAFVENQITGLKALLNSGSNGTIYFGTYVRLRDICIDSVGRYYIMDIAYGKRVYRLNNDLTFDDTWPSAGTNYMDINSYTSNPESILVMPNGTIFIGDRLNRILEFDSVGTYVQTIDLSAQLVNLLLGGIANYDNKLYVTDKNTVYEYTEAWVYTGNSWDIRFNGTANGNNAYGLEKTPDGWVIPDINDDAFNTYDNNFVNTGSISTNGLDVVTGVVLKS